MYICINTCLFMYVQLIFMYVNILWYYDTICILYMIYVSHIYMEDIIHVVYNHTYMHTIYNMYVICIYMLIYVYVYIYNIYIYTFLFTYIFHRFQWLRLSKLPLRLPQNQEHFDVWWKGIGNLIAQARRSLYPPVILHSYWRWPSRNRGRFPSKNM